MEQTEQQAIDPKVQAVRDYAAHCNGTENYYRVGLGNLLYTDGVKHVAETCGAFWLIDLVSSWQPSVRRKAIRLRDAGLSGFQLWQLTHEPKGAQAQRWVARCWSDTPGTGVKLAAQVIPYCDFPVGLSPFKLYVEGGVLYLPEER